MGTQERREREKEQRRNDILDAAEKVFFSEGLHESTMDDVAETAELSKGTLYLYFKSKEELYLGIHQRGFMKLQQMFHEASQSQENGLEKIRAIGYAYFEFAQNYPEYYQAIMYFEKTILDISKDNNLMDQQHHHGIDIMDFVKSIIREGIQDGSIKPDIDFEKMAFILWGQVSGIIQIVSKISRNKNNHLSFEPEELFKEYLQISRVLLENTNKEGSNEK